MICEMENMMGHLIRNPFWSPTHFPGARPSTQRDGPPPSMQRSAPAWDPAAPDLSPPDLSLPQRSNMLVHRPGVIWTSHPRASHPFGTSLDPGGPAWSRWSYTAMSPFPRRATCRTSWDTHEDLLGPLDDLPSPPQDPSLTPNGFTLYMQCDGR